MEESYAEKCIKERKEMTPDHGFNVCTFDDFAPPGEMLTLVAHVQTLFEAEKIKKEYESLGETCYIYCNESDTSKLEMYK